jgi:hypothetical protein
MRVSEDLEDVVALVDGCVGLEAKLKMCEPVLRGWIAAAIQEVLTVPMYREVALAHLPLGGPKADRERRLLEIGRAHV